MLAKIIGWFQTPTFPEDEDKTCSALLLNVILNTFLITMPIIFAGIVLGDFAAQREIILTIIVYGWLALFGMCLTMLTGRVVMAGTLTVLILFIATTLALYNRGTVRAPVITFYILAIIIAGLTISRRAIIWTAVFSTATSTILLVAERAGVLPKPDFSTANLSQGVILVVVFTFISILLFLSVKIKDEALVRVQHELDERAFAREREIKRREMMEKVIQIGKAVAEQTTDLPTALLRIRNSVQGGLDFDRAAIFLYNPSDETMRWQFWHRSFRKSI